jgi:hypothetical protein
MALATGILALTGCATGYALVQPGGAGSGSYYTSEGPYSGQGYYDYYGTGPYYPGTSDWGYYNGTSPYSNAFGWYGANYEDFDLWPPFIFNIGVSGVWGFPGYWGPWYSTGFTIWGCGSRDCGHQRGHHRHHKHDPVATTSPHPWLKPDHAPAPPHLARGGRVPVAIPARPRRGFPDRPLKSAAFAPHDFARGAMGVPATAYRPIGVPAKPASIPQEAPAFADRPVQAPRMEAPHDFSASPRPVSRPMPVARPAQHSTNNPGAKIR